MGILNFRGSNGFLKLDRVGKETIKVDPQACKTQAPSYRAAFCAANDSTVYVQHVWFRV